MGLPKPLRDYVLAQPAEAQTKTKSGIILPDSAAEKSEEAVVKAIGKDVKEVKVGDHITYKSYSTTEKKVGNDKYILVKEEDIVAVG
jgi:chaperonin GroES